MKQDLEAVLELRGSGFTISRDTENQIHFQISQTVDVSTQKTMLVLVPEGRGCGEKPVTYREGL